MRTALYAFAAVALLLSGANAPAGTQAPGTFAAQVAALSEPGGYFDTDNLISNERSYLDVLPELKKRGVRGGAYIGVGPDQNFSYIAAVRPDIAFIVDIRRDNLLLHLLFKSLFSLARTRIEYLSLLVGREVPADLDPWRGASIDRVLTYADRAPLDGAAVAALRARVDGTIARIGVPLLRDDLTTIDRFHRRFIEAGTGLQFQSTGRPPQRHYPTLRDLLAATEPSGQPANYLASEDAFQFIKGLHQRDLIIPVVGDLSGSRAIAAIGNTLRERGQRSQPGAQVSAFYASNVEFYLFGDARFARFVTNLRALPRASHAVVIRSVFGRYGWSGGGGSWSQLQSIDELVEGYGKGKYQYYEDLIGR
jgi:hypothetical protein